MSTRSGKRIHQSFHENIMNKDVGDAKSEKTMGSRRLKGNHDALNISLPKNRRKKANYVSYPTDDERLSDENPADNNNDVEPKPTRKQKKIMLKEINIEKETNTIAPVSCNEDVTLKPVVRLTRRTKRFADDEPEPDTEEVVETKKTRKNKKKKKQNEKQSNHLNKENDQEEPAPQKKKRKTRKGAKRSGSMTVEDVDKDLVINEKQKSQNNTNTSIDSFHSAAGSPINIINYEEIKNKRNSSHKNSVTSKSEEVSEEMKVETQDNAEVETNNKTLTLEDKNLTCEKISDTTVIDNNSIINTTFEKDDPKKSDSIMNISKQSERKSMKGTKKLSRQSAIGSLNSTYEKTNEKKLDTTFDKDEGGDTASKSSLISSDNTNNLTFDKSEENISKISITSDESSKTENILNTTPLLIESSLENSKLGSPNDNHTPPTPLKREGTFTKDGPDVIMVTEKITTPSKRVSLHTTPSIRVTPHTTPSKRATLHTTPSKSESVNTTPSKKVSLPAAGCTPYHSGGIVTRNSVLNVTCSLDKPSRASLLEQVKQTKVMFCSPVDNPAIRTDRKSKVIKSSMKGSNKSFVFEEKAPSLRSSRKRSLTDCEESHVKRSRLTHQLSGGDRLSRPRTSSAAAKLTNVITPKKAGTGTPFKAGTGTPFKAGTGTPFKAGTGTPFKAGTGTPFKAKSDSKPSKSKLPNFAALHQKQFEKMESLDECQLRKAKRARALLVPTGGLTVLERCSPKSTLPEPPKSVTKVADTKKPETPQKNTKTDVKPGYTRFGFKLNLDENPFSIPSKTAEVKPSEKKPNGLLKRQAMLPSIVGGTVRKDVAKKVILRERSQITLKERTNVVRKENRTIIKGVRTNRRFELQMRSRNIN